eukprot:TRINITY_DN25007_c0_g1_i1.p1 TRINITY_DN25007_c0_g1~~TRINITY_DN25007_c0_g1_i1.p1  ORF type:complete len:480 (+),score=119.65 TRINITY_DN25007_c0_g1_i1:106-1545(+)
MHVARVGTFRQRSKQAKSATASLRQQRRQRLAWQTQDHIEDFEKNIQALHLVDADDIPDEAESLNGSRTQPLAMMTGTALPPQPRHGDEEVDPRLLEKAKHRRSMLGRSQSALALTGLTAESIIPPIEKDPHEERPPSPLAFYNYGCISQRPRSRQGQVRKDSGELGRARHRLQGQGFYFPGAQCRNGPYGFSLQDPILYPPGDHGHQQSIPARWRGDCADMRPASAPDLEQKRCAGNPVISSAVRTTKTHTQRANRAFAVIDKRRDDAWLEQVRFENGMFEANFRDPLLESEKSGISIEQALPMDFSWLRAPEEDMSRDQKLAAKILLGIELMMVENRSKLPQLFAAEDQGPMGILELDVFLQGLVRIEVLRRGEANVEALRKAMFHLDSEFDARVNLRALGRGLPAAQAIRLQRQRERQAASHAYEEKITQQYHERIPVEKVKVDRNPRSLYDFEKSMRRFTDQQRALLVLHKEVKK